MQNDLNQVPAPLPRGFNLRIASISEHPVSRPEAHHWAHSDIKFLIDDDTDVKTNGYDKCLPQPRDDGPESEKHEQQLGIQAMDIVFHRALVTAGLHDITITDSLQMSAISAIASAGTSRGNSRRISTIEPIMHGLSFLQSLLNDCWYTRAWVVQEALSAGSGLMIVLRRGNQVEQAAPEMPSKVICLPVETVRQVIRGLKNMLQQNFLFNGQTLQRDGSRPQDLLRGAGKISEAAEQLHPRLAREDSRHVILQVIGGYSYGSRRTVDAAGALTLLKKRDCRNKEDLVAIVANMCGFDIRLDTRAVRDHGSLREAIIALTLMNGNLSLLVPEAYGSSNVEFNDSNGNGTDTSITWVYPFDQFAAHIDHLTIRNFNIHSLPEPTGTLISLSPIRYQYEKIWEEMKCLHLVIDKLDKETPDDFLIRRIMIGAHFGRQTALHQAKTDLFLATELPPESRAWGDINNASIRVTQYMSAHRIEEVPEMQRIVSEILFAILRFLYNSGKEDPRAQGLSSSIWQSLRVDVVNGREDLPDVVTEASTQKS
ncbi:hypothetical protein GGR57DRAFT_513848 [Xylariaceae sp. FL1272]|nr:hypothetical protein GGR57DRAFT_513848 [Xylariaceae sp. FL1272]